MTGSNRKKALVVQPIHEAGMKIFAAREDIEVQVLASTDEQEILEAARDADGITVRTARITKAIIEAAPRLQIVARHGVGYDSVDVAALTARSIPLTIAIQSNATSVAEQAMAMILALAKQVLAFDRGTRQGDWTVRNRLPAFDLEGKTLLVVGYGRIGRKIAARAAAFGMAVQVIDPYAKAGDIYADGHRPVTDLMAALPEVDVVTIHAPRNDETVGMFGAAQLAAMKPSAILVNCARGGLIDEAALHGALTGGGIAGAGLDVFDVEPVAADHPLLRLDNVVVSPHAAGVSREASIRAAQAVAQSLCDAFDGRLDPATVVNRQVL